MIKSRTKDPDTARHRITEQKKESQININIDQRLSKARKSTKAKVKRSKSISNRKICKDGCVRHDFQLKPIGYSTFLSKCLTQTIPVNFCSKGNSTTIPIPIVPLELTKEPHIPLFILDQQIPKYLYYIDSHREQFYEAISKANKIADDNTDEDIIIPIPKTKNCQICKLKIDNEEEYQRHISSFQHKQAIKKALGSKYIMQQTEEYQYEQKYTNQIKLKMDEMCEVSKLMREAKKTLKALVRRENKLYNLRTSAIG